MFENITRIISGLGTGILKLRKTAGNQRRLTTYSNGLITVILPRKVVDRKVKNGDAPVEGDRASVVTRDR